MSKTDWIAQEIEGLKAQGLYNRIPTIGSPQGAWLVVDGKKVLNFCSNNYLGLANHPRLVAAAKKAADEMGVGPAAVRTIAGTTSLHLELEKRLAAFKGVEAAITFQSGFTANLATIPALVAKEDAIFSDRLNHASIIDGCRLSAAKIIPYEHCDVGSLESVVKENLSHYRRAIIITDGVFSMDGDVAPLDRIYEVARMFDILLMVVIGGMGTLYGSVLGAALFIVTQNYLQDLMKLASNATSGVPLLRDLVHPDRWLLWLGILFIVSIYRFPIGIVGKLRLKARRPA